MFKVNNKDTRTMPTVSFCCLYDIEETPPLLFLLPSFCDGMFDLTTSNVLVILLHDIMDLHFLVSEY